MKREKWTKVLASFLKTPMFKMFQKMAEHLFVSWQSNFWNGQMHCILIDADLKNCGEDKLAVITENYMNDIYIYVNQLTRMY